MNHRPETNRSPEDVCEEVSPTRRMAMFLKVTAAQRRAVGSCLVPNGDYDSTPGDPMPELPPTPYLSKDQIETGDPNGDYETKKPEPTGGWILPGE